MKTTDSRNKAKHPGAKVETMKVGPFSWKRDDHDQSECWDLVTPESMPVTFFCVKNYGGRPSVGQAFSGWRLVSGGPYVDVGGWTSREDAMRGVIPFLLKYFREEAAEQIAEAERVRKALAKWLKDIGP